MSLDAFAKRQQGGASKAVQRLAPLRQLISNSVFGATSDGSLRFRGVTSNRLTLAPGGQQSLQGRARRAYSGIGSEAETRPASGS